MMTMSTSGGCLACFACLLAITTAAGAQTQPAPKLAPEQPLTFSTPLPLALAPARDSPALEQQAAEAVHAAAQPIAPASDAAPADAKPAPTPPSQNAPTGDAREAGQRKPAPAPSPGAAIPPVSSNASLSSSPLMPPRKSSEQQAQSFVKDLAAHKKARVAQHLEQGRRLLDKRQYGKAAGEFALAYLFDARGELLREVARALRKGELDYEALAVYLRLQQEPNRPEWRDEIEEELRALGAKLEDTEMGVAQALREYTNLAGKNFKSGQFTNAAQDSALGYAIKPLPKLLFNAAQAYRRAGQAEDAYFLYSRYLEVDPRTPLRNESLGYLKELRAVAFKRPAYKRGWFWGVLGTAAAVLAAGGAGLGVVLRPQDRATDLGSHGLTFPFPLSF